MPVSGTSRPPGTKPPNNTRTGKIRGVVKSEQGPIIDAQVVIEDGPQHPDIAALTDDQGRFSFGSLTPGKYVIRVYGSGGASDPIQVPVIRGKTAFVEVWLDTAEPIPEEEVIDEI
jgi:hypothetical protein